MAFEFRLPDVGEGLAEAEIVAWRVAVGDVVAMDEVVVEVETDKALVEVPIPVAGTVLHLGGAEGDTVDVGAVLLVVGDADETWPPPPEESGDTLAEDVLESGAAAPDDSESASDEDQEEPAEHPVTGDDAAPIVGTLGSEFTVLDAAEEATSDPTSGVRALPVVRKLARELGVDLTEVEGTGPHGRITRDDVTAAAEERSHEPRVPDHTGRSPEPTVEDAQPEPDEPRAQDHTGRSHEPRVSDHTGGEGRQLSRLRRTIAERMTRSWSEIPHVTSFDEVDATRLLEVKRALSKRTGSPIPLDALVVKAVLPALADHPDFTARLDGDRLIGSESVDMGVAVDTPDGLMVVVIRNAADLSLTEVAREVVRLAEAARDRKTTPREMSGQTFTVSNIGAVGGGHGTPIVPYGTIGILSVGRAVDRPVARDGRVTIAPMMPLSLSYDHRVIDGGEGRRFLAQIVENLTEPALFLAD